MLFRLKILKLAVKGAILYLPLSYLLSLSVFGQKPMETTKPTPTPERPRQIVALLNDARLAAPELGVDTFLKVVETKKVTDPVWRKEIIDEALRMIDDVQYPMPMRPAFGKQNEINDTAEYILATAYYRRLDRLSLTGRVITLLLETDRDRAKRMIFQMGGQFELKPRSCEDVMTYMVNDFYPVVAKVATASFSEQQIAEGQRALFISPWIENIESPTQISPALDLVQQMQGAPVERQILFNALSKLMNRDFKDDRSFTNSLKWANLAGKVAKVAAGEPDLQKTELINAYRSMLVKNFRGPRCKDNEIKKDEPLPDYIEAANKLMPEKPLAFEDVVASEIGGTVKITHLLAKSAFANKIRDELIPLKGTVIDNKIVNHDISDADWVLRVTELVDKVLAYDGTSGETESEIFFLRGAFLGSILESVDPGELKNSIIRKYIRVLSASKLQKTSFIEWFDWVNFNRQAPLDLFFEVAPEFPNPNFKVMVAAKKIFDAQDKAKKPAPETQPKPANAPVKP